MNLNIKRNLPISDDKYSWFDTANDLRKQAEKKKSPLIGTFEITARCNLACKMCYIRREDSIAVVEREKSARDWIDLGAQAAKAGTLFLLITGGEPLIRPDFKEIYESLNKMGFIITLYTNATLINEAFISWISKIPPNKIEVTLYGASPEVYKLVTGSSKAFQKTLNGIDLLIRAGIKVALRTTIIHDNVEDIEAMDVIAKERSLDINHVFSLVKPVRGALSCIDGVRLSPAEVVEMNAKDNSLSDDCETVYKYPTKKVNVSKKPMFCAAGKCSYWITWDGKLLPCAMMNSPYSEPFSSNFISAWEELKESIINITSPKECSSCELYDYCSVCPAKLQAETGSFEKLSPYICEMAKLIGEKFGDKTREAIL